MLVPLQPDFPENGVHEAVNNALEHQHTDEQQAVGYAEHPEDVEHGGSGGGVWLAGGLIGSGWFG